MDLGLCDRVYVVTGGSRGLGRATADALVADGARVVVSSRSQDNVDHAVATLGTESAVGVVGDLADPGLPTRLVETALERFGRLDGGLVSVGGPPQGTALEATDEQWSTAFESVFLGTVRTMRHLVSHLADGAGGSVAVVLSTTVKSPAGDLAISNGFRPGIGMVVKQLADEVGRRGVRVNGLLPGRIATDRIREIDAHSAHPEALEERNANVSLGRTGEPDEFGRVAAFVLSPAASYVTGSMIPVDGGAGRSL
jgi:3-oxoacyl-[acyl-carrier protein] reductase